MILNNKLYSHKSTNFTKLVFIRFKHYTKNKREFKYSYFK